MKRKWKHPEEPESSRVYWRSVGELEGSKEFSDWLEREFPQGAQEMEMDETSRRSFVKLMGASTALAGFGVACKRPVQHLVPYNEHVEWVIPGKALYYSTAKPRLGGLGCDPLVVTTYEGRPTKVDGNRLHPAVGGGSSAWTQASVLDLYDRDRSRGYLRAGQPTASTDFDEAFLKPFREAKDGKGVGILVSESTSPTRNRLLEEVAKAYPGIRTFSYEALAPNGARAAGDALYGEGSLPVVNLREARRILSLDCDFVGNEPVGEDSATEFSATRDPEGGDMSRLYMAEQAFSLTGGMADHRYRIPASQILPVAALVARELSDVLGDGELKALSDGVLDGAVDSVYDREWIRECARDLADSSGSSIVLAGGRQPEVVHLLVAAINRALGAYGPIITIVDHKLPALEGITDLAAALESGDVSTLFVLNEGDLAFDAPSDLDFPSLLAEAGEVVHIGTRVNVTARLAGWHVPGAHYLESWGDHYSVSGVYSVQQPMIDPLWGGISENAFLLSLLGEEPEDGEPAGAAGAAGGVAAEEVSGEEAVLAEVKKTFAEVGGEDWTATVRDGFLAGKKLPTGAFEGAVSLGEADLKIADLPHEGGFEVALTTSHATYDGRFANNGWMQEAPDPITKLTWDNAALMSFSTAEELGVEEDGQMVELTIGERRLLVPALRSPGHADYCISLPVGYYGDLAEGAVSDGAGFNVYPLMTTAHSYVVPGVSVRVTRRTYPLALTSEHYSMEGRAIAREGTLEMYEEDSHFAEHQGMDHHIPPTMSLYEGPDYKNPENNEENSIVPQLDGHEFRVDPLHQWAMTIDLNSCIGCNACVVACQAENNIPIVGKDQVMKGREMHWIRMDRYFSSPKDHLTIAQQGIDFEKNGEPGRRRVADDYAEMIPQPVACQQCESAPCETVCPVNATVHTPDGLNAMTYNRCIGTRYCANNCPYKARRFNYFDYNKRPLDKLYLGPLAPAEGNARTTQKLQKNPNVTVRMRGVIEKCTYCVQRLNSAKIAAKVAARDSADIQVPANSVTVACQDACSLDAIQFGNLKNAKDSLNKAKKNPRNYDLLKYIGTLPRTSYLARIKNPNAAMPGADKVGTVTSKMH